MIMCGVRKALSILFVAALGTQAAFAVQPSIEDGGSALPARVNGPAYRGPIYAAPADFGPPPYSGPYYGSQYRGRTWGRGSGSGHVRVSFDFDGFANGCMPWSGWW